MDLSSLCVEDYQPADAGQLMGLLQRALAPYGLAPDACTTDSDLRDVSAAYLAGGGRFRVIRRAGRVIGMYGLHNESDGVVELRKMYLEPECKGRGLGRMMMEDALSLARQAGFRRMVLETNSRLVEAIAMYRKYGFLEDSRGQVASRCDMAMAMDL